MSNVIAFPKRPPTVAEPVKRFPPVTPWPAWKLALRDRYWSRDNWRTSQKGNLYVLIDGRCITWFRQRDGWSWSISVAGGGDEPLWSKRLHPSERDARADAFDALVAFYEGPNEEGGRRHDDSHQPTDGRRVHRRDRHNGGAEDVVRQPQSDLHRC